MLLPGGCRRQGPGRRSVLNDIASHEKCTKHCTTEGTEDTEMAGEFWAAAAFALRAGG